MVRRMHANTVLASAAFLVSALGGAPPPVLVGVLEEPQCQPELGRIVRVLFAKVNGAWRPLDSADALATLQPPSNWTVAFDGRSLGSVKTVDSGLGRAAGRASSRDRVLLLAPPQSAPAVANRAKVFGGWCEEPATRPLVVVSRPHFSDPARWRPFRLGQAYQERLFGDFKAAVAGVSICPAGTDGPVPFRFTSADLVSIRGYRDRTGRTLVALGFDPERHGCDGPPAPEWTPQWFLVVGEKVRHLGAELSLVDAGDYDADGESEVLFWHSGYNRDGYSLFSENFTKRADYWWSYH